MSHLPSRSCIEIKFKFFQSKICFSSFSPFISFFFLIFAKHVLNNQVDVGPCAPASPAHKICARGRHTGACTRLRRSSSLWRTHGFTHRDHVRGFFTPLSTLLKGRRLKGKSSIIGTVSGCPDPVHALVFTSPPLTRSRGGGERSPEPNPGFVVACAVAVLTGGVKTTRKSTRMSQHLAIKCRPVFVSTSHFGGFRAP